MVPMKFSLFLFVTNFSLLKIDTNFNQEKPQAVFINKKPTPNSFSALGNDKLYFLINAQ